MAKRHQGTQPTFQSLTAQNKVMTMGQGAMDLSKQGGIKKIVGRGGGLHGLSGDKHVWGRYTGEEKTNPEKRPKTNKRYVPNKIGSTLLTK